MDFIPISQATQDRKVTYANMVCDYRPLNIYTNQLILIMDGGKLDYNDYATSPEASFTNTQLLLNSVILDARRGARFLTLDIKAFLLQSTMERPEHMRIHSKYFMPDIRNKYNIDTIISPNVMYTAVLKELCIDCGRKRTFHLMLY